MDESGAAGLAKGLRKTLDARMWTGHGWARVGDLLADWLVPVGTQTLSPAEARLVAHLLKGALALGPSTDEIERMGE